MCFLWRSRSIINALDHDPEIVVFVEAGLHSAPLGLREEMRGGYGGWGFRSEGGEENEGIYGGERSVHGV